MIPQRLPASISYKQFNLLVIAVLLFTLAPAAAIAAPEPPPPSTGVPVPSDKQPPLQGAPDARQAPAETRQSVPSSAPRPDSVVFTEGFEGGVMPPERWSLQTTNVDYTWGIETWLPHTGAFRANIEYDPGLVPQSEWLLSPPVYLITGTLSFWSFGSVYWCRDTYDNCNLEVWLVRGPQAGDGDDIYVNKADASWPGNWTWGQTVLDLASFLPDEAVRVGLRYWGVDGAEVALDDIVLDGTVRWRVRLPLILK